MPPPFAQPKNTVELGRLSEPEAIQLVEQVMAHHGWEPPITDNATTPAEITELVETVNRHPRALVLLAQEVANGVRATTQSVAQLMAKLEAQNPGDRENSLYASVELSLRRLPTKMREQVNRLAVIYGGANLFVLSQVMGLETDRAEAVAEQLIGVGMAEAQEYSYLRLDPALPAYLKRGQAPEQLADLEAAWAEAMIELVDYLYQQFFKDSTMALRLTLLELPNLMALLDWLEQRVEVDSSTSEVVSQTIQSIEQLLAHLNRPQALARTVALRERVAAAIPDWGNARFENERLLIERLLQQGQLQPADEKARALLEKAKAVGPTAYSGADYHLAIAHFMLGRVLKMGGQAALALDLFLETQRLFEELDGACSGMMAPRALTELADCLMELGRLDEATETYKESIKRCEKLQDSRGVAAGKIQLSIVMRKQGKYAEAVADCEEARAVFEQQNEPTMVAIAWHQIGMVHHVARHYDEAEAAYRQSLEIKTRIKYRSGQASSLNQLGILYWELNRLEEAITFLRQAIDIDVVLKDLRNEAVERKNIANILLKLKRYDEARSEIMQAIACNRQFGHAGEPWTAFNILHKIETATGNQAAWAAAWRQARDAYLAYRRQGGYAQYSGGKLVDHVLGLIAQQQGDEIQPLLNQLAQEPDTPDSLKQLMQAVVTILNGSRDLALAEDSALVFRDAAEVLFLIERLGG